MKIDAIKFFLSIVLILLILNQSQIYASDLNTYQRIKNLIEWHKNSRVQPIIYGYYLIDDWRIFIGLKVKF